MSRAPKERKAEDQGGPPPASTSAPSILEYLWSTGQARRPTLDLATLGPPIKVEADITLSKALQELREESWELEVRERNPDARGDR